MSTLDNVTSGCVRAALEGYALRAMCGPMTDDCTVHDPVPCAEWPVGMNFSYQREEEDGLWFYQCICPESEPVPSGSFSSSCSGVLNCRKGDTAADVRKAGHLFLLALALVLAAIF